MSKTDDFTHTPTVEGLLEELAWKSVQLTAWERMATALHGVAVRNPSPTAIHASYVAIQKKRELWDDCQAILTTIANSDLMRRDEDATR